MSNLNSKGKFNKFIMGKGFYIALAVCLIGAGAAAWVSVDKTISSMDKSPLAETPPAQTETSQPAEQKLDNVAKEAPGTTAPLPTESADLTAEPDPLVVPQEADAPVTDVPMTAGEDSTASSPDASPSSAQASASDPQSEPTMQSEPQEQPQASPASSFALPVNAEVMAGFSGDTLVKNVTLNDWRTHNGVDLKAPAGTEVLASCGGTVTSVSNDPLWGNVVEITSGNRVITYSGLGDSIPVNVNDIVTDGQLIGEIGQIPCELNLEPHLHFTVKEDGKFVDPLSLVSEG